MTDTYKAEESASVSSTSVDLNGEEEIQINESIMDHAKSRYPFCIVWTPIPLLTWVFPFIGHMGIALSSGVIRDFAGPYFVSEDDMAFGKPTKYWPLNPMKARGHQSGWDASVLEASEVYKHRMHNLFCDNCHSHVALALNLMHYGNSTSWNMFRLCFGVLLYGKYVSFPAFIKTWVPFVLMASVVAICATFLI